MKKVLFSALLMGTLSGCANYQFGDVSKTAYQGAVGVSELRQSYCEESDPLVRKAILKLIKTSNPTYPLGGICTDILTVIVNENSVSE